jgi:hypothetical protein
MFAILMVAYGTTIANADVQNNMNTLFSGWPTFQQTVNSLSTPNKTCAAWDWSCQASLGIQQATAFVGAVLAYPAILGGSFLSRITAFGNLLSFVTFGSATAFGAVPFGYLFLLALFLVVAIEAFRLFRGSPSGL